MTIADCLSICVVSVVVALVAEFSSWFFIYRTPAYQKDKERIEQAQEQLDKMKEKTLTIDKQRKQDRKVAALEKQLKDLRQSFAMASMKSNMFLSVGMIVCYQLLSSSYEGLVVAKLPFEAMWFFKGITHRGLAGEDYTEAGFAFVYVLCSMGLRSNIKKLLGFAPPKGAEQPSLFTPPTDGKYQ